MSKNIHQVYVTNPITSNAGTDLMYFGQSPYGAGNDAAMLYSSFSAQFVLNTVLTTKGDLLSFSTVNARLAVGTVDGQILQVHSAAAVGLAYSTPTYPSASGSAGKILRSDATNNVYSTSTFADTYAVSTILYASGSNAVSGLAAAQNGVLVSGNTNIPVMLAGPGATGRVLQSNAALAPSWSTSTFPSVGGAAGNILISDGTNYIASTSLWPNTVGSSGKILQSNGTSNGYTTATYPSVATGTGTMLRADGTNWVASTATFADTYAVSTLLYAGSSNAVSGLATVNDAVLATDASGIPTWRALTDGQLLIGSSAGAPLAGNITTSGNISITNGHNTIALAGTGMASFTWNDVSGTTQAASAYSGYICSNAAQTTITLPATAAEGTVFAVQGKGAAGWILQANTGQTIHLGSSATSSAGSLTSTNQWDSVQIVCVTANTTFAVISVVGNLTVA